jgi:hypothetical protein
MHFIHIVCIQVRLIVFCYAESRSYSNVTYLTHCDMYPEAKRVTWGDLDIDVNIYLRNCESEDVFILGFVLFLSCELALCCLSV